MTGQTARPRREIVVEGPNSQIMRERWTLPAEPEYLAVLYRSTRQG